VIWTARRRKKSFSNDSQSRKINSAVLPACLPFSRLLYGSADWENSADWWTSTQYPAWPPSVGRSVRHTLPTGAAFPAAVGARPSRPPNHTTYHVRRRQRPARAAATVERASRLMRQFIFAAAAAAATVEPIESSGIAEYRSVRLPVQLASLHDERRQLAK